MLHNKNYHGIKVCLSEISKIEIMALNLSTFLGHPEYFSLNMT